MHVSSPIIVHRCWRDFLQPCFDALAILVALAAVTSLSGGTFDAATLSLGLVTAGAFLFVAQWSGLNRGWAADSADWEMARVAATWTVAVVLLAVGLWSVGRASALAGRTMVLWIALAPSVIGCIRMAIRTIETGRVRYRVGVRRVAIAGCNPLGQQTAANIERDPSLGLRLVGIYDDRSQKRVGQSERVGKRRGDSGQLRGNLAELVAAARCGEVDTVLITLPMRAEDRIRYLLDQFSDSATSVYIVPDFFVFELLHSRWIRLGGLPAVSIFENPLFGVDGAAKRIADLCLAGFALAVAAVPMLLIALAVKLTSPGPVIFRQRRYGLDGREIRVWKFRTMRTCEDGATVRQATVNDDRVTPVGAILRRTSLDELPQLLNVLAGQMSLVGPRPHATAHNEQYRGLIRGYMLRHKIKPGITGLAQINGCRGATETLEKMQRRIEWDHQYIRRWSLMLDLKILVKTLLVVWRQPEAY